MENRAIYQIIENSESHIFTAHNGANALPPLLRLVQAKEIQSKLDESQSIAHIFAHLGDDGQYYNPWLPDEDMFCDSVESEQRCTLQERYEEYSDYEMHITLDLDHDNCNLNYNPNCPWYRTMGSLSISLTDGLANVEKLMEHGEKRGITDFYQLLAIYDRSTGLDGLLENARGGIFLLVLKHQKPKHQSSEGSAAIRTVDISPLIADMQAMPKTAGDKQKELLRQEILQMSGYALSGEIVEWQFYISL